MGDDSTLPMPFQPDHQSTLSISGGAGPAASPARERSLPQTIGHYKILRLLGEGGMGSVYQAEQQQPHRIVALKVIKPGFATPDLIRRFEQESQALGRLQHTGIAQIFEAGSAQTDFGAQPYFAMEFIDGRPLIDYAEEHHLNARQRLELMSKVCEAVHHAHQRGIVHRDLKPANILVDASAQPKVLDFGIARVTDSDAYATRQTDVGQLIGTIAYMSPEQVLADPLEIDTRSDVYALGVVYYELMAGRLPYNSNRKLLHEMMQAIREDEPSRLSSVNRLYRGDIEIIAAKALEKEKARRYSSAAGMGSDIRRYLNDEPIIARPPTTMYQLQKFARRHRALVAGALVVSAVLIAGSVVSTWQAVRATRAERLARQAEVKTRTERDRATTAESIATQQRDRAILAEKTATSERDRAVKAEVQARQDRDRSVIEKQRADGEAATAKAISQFLQTDLLEQANTTTQTAGSKPDPDIKVRTVLDRAAARVTDRFNGKPQVEAAIQATIGSAYTGLGLYDESQRHLTKSLALYREALGHDHPDTLSVGQSLGEVNRAAGKYAQAESLLEESVEGFRRSQGATSGKTLDAMNSLASVYIAEGKHAQAEPLLRQVMETERQTLGAESPAMLDTMNTLARVYFIQGKMPEAERLLSNVIAVRRRALGTDHPSTIGAMNNLAVLYQSQFRYREAGSIYATLLDVNRRVLGPEHPDTLNVMNNLGVLHFTQGKYSEAEALFLKVFESWRRQLGPEHPRTLTLLRNLAALHQAEGKFSEAESLATQVLEARRRVLGPAHPDTLDSLHNLADLYSAQRNYSAAEPLFVQALDGSRRFLGHKHQRTTSVLSGFGELRLEQGRYAEAESFLRECLSIQQETTPDDFRRYRAESSLGASLEGQKKYADAEPLLISGYEGLKQRESRIPASNRSKVNQAGERIVQFYDTVGKPEEAAKWRERLKP
jgi:serine/threonine protein kinase/tetratricopeptide (TPR) repeat protein